MEKAYGLEIPQSLEEACDPVRTALLVYDIQVGIIRQLKDGGEIVARVKTVLDVARVARLRVFFMRHMSLPKEATGVVQLRMAMAWQRVKTVAEVKPWFLRDSPGVQLVPELSRRAISNGVPSKADIVILSKTTSLAKAGNTTTAMTARCRFLVVAGRLPLYGKTQR